MFSALVCMSEWVQSMCVPAVSVRVEWLRPVPSHVPVTGLSISGTGCGTPHTSRALPGFGL